MATSKKRKKTPSSVKNFVLSVGISFNTNTGKASASGASLRPGKKTATKRKRRASVPASSGISGGETRKRKTTTRRKKRA